MNQPDVFPIEPWTITEPNLDLGMLGQTESIFALSNGHVGLRGNLDEGEPHHTPGSYLNGFFEMLPMPYAEDGYGYPEQGQTLLNVTNGKLIRLLVNDEPFDVRYGTLNRHERQLNMRDGVLRRDVEWVSPAGQAVRIRSTRLVSFAQRAVAAVRYEVEPIGESSRIVVQSSMVANEPLPSSVDDPRGAAVLKSPLISEFHTEHDLDVALGHRTEGSDLRMAAALDHVFECPAETATASDTEEDLARVTFSTELQPGQKLTIVKFLAYGWSAQRSMPALRDQVDAALAAAKHTGWDGLLAEQRTYLDDVWDDADVEIEGDERLQQAVRFAIFQAVQASARAEQRAIPAKGLTGRGYDGHTFWDMDTYQLQLLTYVTPKAARDALLWRHSTLDYARDRARELRLEGATFPWRTIRGDECSGYWPAGTAAFHINADVADAVRRYVAATDDQEFAEGPGFDLLVDTARLWAKLGHHDAEGCFRIDGITGPDEYTALVDNNVFTNLMAARNLRVAAAAVRAFPDRAKQLGVSAEEAEAWCNGADNMVVPFDSELGVTAQSEGFTRYRLWDFDATNAEEYPLLLHYPYYLLYSSQVVKQADLVMALYMCGDNFTPEQKRKDFEYYEKITVRDSSLSASIQAIVAAEVGHLDLAAEYLRESAFVDLHDLSGNAEDGLHLAAMAGSWLGAVAGFGGMRDYGEHLAFAPRIPQALGRLTFRMMYRGRRLRVAVSPQSAEYTLRSGEPLEVLHHGEAITLSTDGPVEMPCPAPEELAEPVPPPGRVAGEPSAGREVQSTSIGRPYPWR